MSKEIKPRILVVDDEVSMCEFLQIMLQKENYQVLTSTNPEKALQLVEKDFFDLVITDMAMPEMDGLTLLCKVKGICPETAVMVITAFGTTENAIEAMKSGAFDYITKPFNNEEIKITILKCLQSTRLERENLFLKRQMQLENRFGNMVGSSSGMKEIYELIQVVRNNKSNVLITGESGTGKELVAREIHYQGNLSEKPFITVNCGAIPETLMESELFGHVRGAFTGAVSNRRGLFKSAEGGTIFLDEIGEVPAAMQVKLLRVLQTKIVRPVGSTEDFSVDFRIIAATNKNLAEAVQEKRFREDLYFRLNVIHMHVPPLRERREDIPSLIRMLVDKISKELGKDIKKVGQEFIDRISKYSFPGNIRELENIIERSIALEKTTVLLGDSLSDQIPELSANGTAHGTKGLPAADIDFKEAFDLEKHLNGVEQGLLLRALQEAQGVKSKAAKLLGLSFRSFRYRLEKHGLD